MSWKKGGILTGEAKGGGWFKVLKEVRKSEGGEDTKGCLMVDSQRGTGRARALA